MSHAPVFALKVRLKNLRSLSLTFSAKKKNMNTDELAINWKNFDRVQLQLKFAFIIQPKDRKPFDVSWSKLVPRQINEQIPFNNLD